MEEYSGNLEYLELFGSFVLWGELLNYLHLDRYQMNIAADWGSRVAVHCISGWRNFCMIAEQRGAQEVHPFSKSSWWMIAIRGNFSCLIWRKRGSEVCECCLFFQYLNSPQSVHGPQNQIGLWLFYLPPTWRRTSNFRLNSAVYCKLGFKDSAKKVQLRSK
jgi:hypothetical protein